MRRILIATEGSTISAAAIRQFIAVLGTQPFELFVLSVITRPTLPDQLPQVIASYDGAADAALSAIDHATAELRAAGLPAQGLVRTGEPAPAIVACAKEIGADLIVLGSHGRKGAERMLHGSVAESVLMHAPCGVLIYPVGVTLEVAGV
ncbi:putative universal stress protein [compost metagenome]